MAALALGAGRADADQGDRGAAACPRVRARDWGTLLDLSGDYGIAELKVQDEDWVTGRRLRELRLRDEGVSVVGIHREGRGYVGAPGPETVVQAGDSLVLYGREERISELDHRRRGAEGDQAHQRACSGQRRMDDEQAA